MRAAAGLGDRLEFRGLAGQVRLVRLADLRASVQFPLSAQTQ
jgi:hypothetical protein